MSDVLGCFAEENLLQVIGDLFAAGMETTATTLCWAILYFLHYPQVTEYMALWLFPAFILHHGYEHGKEP